MEQLEGYGSDLICFFFNLLIETELVVFRHKAIQYWVPNLPHNNMCIGDKLVSIVLIYPDVWGWPPSFAGANALFEWS